MFFQKTMKKILADRGFHHVASDDDFSRHGDYARNLQYAFSKEHSGAGGKIVDLVFLSADMHRELFMIGFFRENVSVEKGVLINEGISIPLAKFSLEEFEKRVDELLPKGSPVKKSHRVSF